MYTNISGLVTVNPTDLKINSCNATFSRLLFGYDEKDLIDKPITFLIPNFLNPDASNVATANTTRLNTTSQRMTPLGVNNSYLNMHEQNQNGYSSSRNNSFRYQTAGASGYRMNRSRLNQSNGSFLEAPSTPNQQRVKPQIVIDACPVENTPEVNKTLELEEQSEPEKLPTASRSCHSCGEAIVTKATNKTEGQRQKDPLVDFNLDYSPNKKCANFIETNTFLPGSPAPSNMDQISAGIHCSAKKSLLGWFILNYL